MTARPFINRDTRLYSVPPRTLVGDGSSSLIGATLITDGCAPGPVAVVADEAVVRLGLAEPAVESLRASGFRPVMLGGVAAEPTVADAREKIAAVREANATAVLGIGGGSAIDLAKFVAMAAPRSWEVETYFGTRDDVGRSLALVAIPTTAGTGAEATRIAMLSVDGRKAIVSAGALVPDLVALDPNLVLSLPPAVTASTGLDALCHAIEALLSANRSPLSIADSREGLRLVSQSLLRSYQSPDDIKARRDVLYGAHFAGRGLNAGVVLGHSVGYTIANRVAIPHGISCAMALPFCLRYARLSAEPTLVEIAQSVTGRPDVDGLIEWIWDLNGVLGVPKSLEAVGISGAAAQMASECLERYPRPNNPTPLALRGLTSLYEAMASGDAATSPIV